VAPDSATVQYAVGLQFIRGKNYKDALVHLKQSSELSDSQPRYAYVYAVAQDSVGNTNAAIDTLLSATERWPNQLDLLSTLVLYLDKVGEVESIRQHLDALQIIAPNSPQVLQLLNKYQTKS
jgi:Flp pilus assembly protein TadD